MVSYFNQIKNSFSKNITAWFSKFSTSKKQKSSLITKNSLFLLLIFIFVLKFIPLFLPPKISVSFPGNKNREVPLDAKIEVIFNKGVIKPLAEKSFKITPTIEGSFSWEGDQKLIFTPRRQLQRSTTYRVSFTGVVLSKFFIPLFGDKTITFETVGDPKVILFSPQNEALEDFTPITVLFDRPMIALTTATNSKIKQSAFIINPLIEGEGRWLGTTVYQFRPSQPFKKATTYEVIVPTGLRSQDGGVIKKEFRWRFSSERPRIIDTSPKRFYEYASPVASISAIFNQNIDSETIADKFFVYDKTKTKVKGKIVVAGNVVGFYPLQPLKREEVYTAVILKGVKGVEGPNGMENDYSWSFKTAAKPEVISTTPKNGDQNVSEEYHIEVVFKTPMDENSFEGNVFIDPQPETKPSLYFSTYNSKNSLSINTYLSRSTTYTITIGTGVKDQYGIPLEQPYRFSFTTAPYKPAVSIHPAGTYFAAFNYEIVPRIVVQVTNANRVDYSLYRLKKEDLLDLYRRRYEQQCGNDDLCRNWQIYNPNHLEKIRSWHETFEAELNTPVHVVTKITGNSGEKIPPGFYFLDVKIPQGAHDNMVMIISKSALTVKKSDKQIFVWAVSQSTNEVVSQMKIEVNESSGKILTDGFTNKDGVFIKEIDLFKKNNLLVFGQKDDDIVVAATAWSEGINPYDFGLPTYYNPNEIKDYYTKENYKIFITLDRPIYRPGQKVYFKGVIKKENDGAYENLQAGEKVVVNINDAQNRIVYSKEIAINSFGSFSGEFTLSKEANLGYYRIEAKFNNNSYTQQFQVEEYRKPDVAVDVRTNKDNYFQSENAVVTISASYYFGTPVVEAPVTWVLKTQDYSFRWDKDWYFEFGDPDSYWSRPWWYYSKKSYYSGEKVSEGKGKTNAKGELEINLPLEISSKKTSQRMIVEATVNDINNQSIASSREFIVHKGELYVGIKPLRYTNQVGKEARIEIVTVDLKGKEVVEVPVTVEFYKRTWETVREKNPDDGLFYYVSKPNDKLVGSQEAKTDSLGRAIVSFTPSEGGNYKVVAKVADKKGNQNISGSFIWVSGSGFSAPRENNDRIVIVTDKQEYLVGENLSVFVSSPFASDSAKTLLTVERGKVLDYKIVDTNETSNNFTLPVLSNYFPNAFIGALLVRGGNELKKPPEFKIGYTEIKVTDKKKQIDVRIKTEKKRYKPKEKLKAIIETKDFSGQPVSAELAVGLVDKAIFDLSDIELPEIYKFFYEPRNLEVFTSHLLTISLDRINANTNLGVKGGSGGGCFTGRTPILMKGGVYKKIKEIRIGDVVLTKENENSAKLVEAKVIKTYKHNVDQYLIINGELEVTPVHRLYVNGRWKKAAEIEVGNYLLDKNNQPVKVFSIERVNRKVDVYNLEIEKYRTYFAGDIYVHNEKGGFDTTRVNFLDTAYWNPHLRTNQEGKAEIEISLPDNLTTWRLIAIANSQEAAFGTSTSEITVNRDVFIRPFSPRFLAVGDEANLGAIIANNSGEDQNLLVKIEGNGLKINGEKSKQLILADGAQSKVVWSTKTENTKIAKIKISVTDTTGKIKDAIEMVLPVKSYSVPETVATFGEAKDIALEKIVLPEMIDPTQGEANITLTPFLGADSINAFSYLYEYPYYCIEQVTSKFISAIFLRRIFKNKKIKQSGSVNINQLEYVINDGIQYLSNFQHSDGGWGWWMEYSSDPLLSAYVFSALIEAKNDGFPVDNRILSLAKDYLKTQLSGKGRQLSLDTQAYILYVLRKERMNLSSYAANLFERRFELSLQSRAYLAIAMREIGGMESQAKRIFSELISLAKKTATTVHWEERVKSYYLIGGNVKTTAAMLEMLTLFDKNNPFIPQIIRYLLSLRHDGHWLTTWDTAAAIKAIYPQLLSKEEKIDENYRLELNGKVLKQGKFTKEDLLETEKYIVSISNFIRGENKLKIIKSGAGNLYYNINLKYYLPFSEIKPLDQGIVVIREFVDEKGQIISGDAIQENSEVWVRLIVVTPEERNYVIVEDFLPAGLEAVNESLKNVSVLNKERPKLKEKSNQFFYFNHKEHHDDRIVLFADHLPAGIYETTYRVRATTPGKYHHLPAQAYQMYFPDVSGHSQGGWLEVK